MSLASLSVPDASLRLPTSATSTPAALPPTSTLASPAIPSTLAPSAVPSTLAIMAPSSSPAVLMPPPVNHATPDTPSPVPQSPPQICFVNAAAFQMLTRIDKVNSRILHVKPSDSKTTTRIAKASKIPSNELDTLHSQIPSEYHDYLDVFSKSKAKKLPNFNPQFDHHIELEEGTHPPLSPIYNTSKVEAEVLCNFLNLDCGFIRQSQSSCSAPVLFIKKKDSLLHLCINWHGLNKITKKDHYPLPLIPNLLDRLRDSNIFTKIDLRGAYNLVCITPGNEWKTTFHTCYGSFDFLVMHFSLTNAPATFQHFMNSVFANVLNKYIMVYLDDILIFSKNPEEHQDNVRDVLACLRKHNLFAKPEKCEFSVDTTEFLSFVISPSGISMAQSKVNSILKWPAPKTVKQVQSFLGFANFYRQFIFNYSDIVVLLTHLTHKGTSWDWTNKADAAFCSLKQSFTEAPVLTHWSPNNPILVETDASDYALTSIISTITPDSEIHPITFHSHTFTETECNYDMHDKELLAIFESFKVWRHYST